MTMIEVSPNATLDEIRNRVPFFKMFSARRYTLHTEGGDTLEESQFGTLLFRDSGLRHGSRVTMREPQREGASMHSEENGVLEEEEGAGEEGGRGVRECGEDEMEEMPEGGLAAEGGEDEMVEE